MLNVFSYICWLSVYLPWESIYLGPLINFFFFWRQKMRIVDWPWARPGRLLRGQSQKPGDFSIQYFPLDRWENWDSENTELGPESFQHLLFSRLWPDRESQRGQLGLKSVCAHEHTHMRTEEVPQLSPRSGYSQIVLCQLKGYQGQCSAGAKVREDSWSPSSTLCFTNTSKRLALPKVLGEGRTNWPSTSEIPPLLSHSLPHSAEHHSVRAC